MSNTNNTNVDETMSKLKETREKLAEELENLNNELRELYSKLDASREKMAAHMKTKEALINSIRVEKDYEFRHMINRIGGLAFLEESKSIDLSEEIELLQDKIEEVENCLN